MVTYRNKASWKYTATINKIFLTVTSALILLSCEPGVNYKKSILNSSDYNIQIIIKSKPRIYHPKDTFILSKSEEVVIDKSSQIGSTNEFENCNIHNDSLYSKIMGNDSLKLTIDLNTAFEFKVTRKGYKNGGDCNCRLIITNDMIK
jgi:hypothetical protein